MYSLDREANPLRSSSSLGVTGKPGEDERQDTADLQSQSQTLRRQQVKGPWRNKQKQIKLVEDRRPKQTTLPNWHLNLVIRAHRGMAYALPTGHAH